MTPVLYFLHLKTLDISLLIVNISVADDAVILRFNFTWKNVNFQQLFVVKNWKEEKPNWRMDFLHLLYNSK